MASVSFHLTPGCDRPPTTAPPATTRPLTVATLLPAATDMLIAMGARDKLVAVSNYDTDRPEIENLPHIGDVQDIDWEKLRELRPGSLVTQIAPERVPQGMKDRAAELGIELVIVNTDRLDDILQTMQRLGQVVGEPQAALETAGKLRAQLSAVEQRVAGRTPVRALILIGDAGLFVAGAETFFDDVLQKAGGVNAAANLRGYPTIDAEMLASLKPQVVLQLLPGVDPAKAREARRFVTTDATLHQFTDPFVLLPGFQVGRLAELFARAMHPDAFAGATTTTAGRP